MRLDPDPIVAQAMFSTIVSTGSVIAPPHLQTPHHEPHRPSWTVDELVRRYLDDAVTRMRPATVRTITWSLTRFAERCGSIEADDVRVHHVYDWLAAESRDDKPQVPGKTCRAWGKSSRNVFGGHVKMAFRWAVDQGYLPTWHLARLRLGKTERAQCVSEEAARRFEAAIPNQALRDWWTVALSCGARPGELFGLRAIDLADDYRSAQVRGKTGERKVYFTDQGVQVLKRLAIKFPAGTLLRNNRGGPWTKISTVIAFSRVCDIAGVEVTPKQTRKLFASRAIKAGVNPAVVAHLLGHSSFDMSFRHYVGFEVSTLADAVSKIR